MTKKEPTKEPRDNNGRFLKGNSGNPSGRPKSSVSISARIRKVLLQERGKDGKVVADVLAEGMVKEALKYPAKMLAFLKEFMDRDEGRTDRRDLEGNDANISAEACAAAIRGAVEAMKASVPGNE